MKVLMLSSDSKIFIPGSEARFRMEEYARQDEFHIIASSSKKEKDITGKLVLYPARNSLFLIKILDFYRIGLDICLNNQIDLISVQGPDEMGLIGFLLSKKFKIPLQLQIHTDVLSSWYRKASLKENLRYHLAKFIIPRADCIRVVSERIKYRLEKSGLIKFGGNVGVLPIFTDINPYLESFRDPYIDKEFAGYDFKMIAVGRFVEKEKNFTLLIKMMTDFVKVCPNALLVLLGSGRDEKTYRSLIRSKKLENNVKIETWRDNLSHVYKSFDLFLMSSNYEGWGRAVIEAMASGLPVVMTDVGLAGEVIKNEQNGLVVPVGDVKKFLKAIQRLYADLNYRKEMALSGFNTVKHMVPKTKEEYLSLYRQKLIDCIKK